MFFSVKKVQENFHDKVNEMNKKSNQKQDPREREPKDKKSETEGEYIDYEEIK